MLFSRQINHFMSITRTGSLAAAAEQSCITASAISKSISELESRLGEKLLHRTRKGVVLTPKGEYLWQELLPHYNDINHIVASLTTRAQQAEQITISMDNIFYPQLKDRLPLLMARYPEKKFFVVPGNDASVDDVLHLQGHDFLITLLEPGAISAGPDICQMAMPPESTGLMVTESLYRQYPDTPSLLKTVSLVQRHSSLQHPLFRILETALQNKGVEFHAMGVQDLTDVCHLVTEGMGVSLMSEAMCHHPLLAGRAIRWVKNPFTFPVTLQRYLYFRRSRFEELADMAMLLQGQDPRQ